MMIMDEVIIEKAVECNLLQEETREYREKLAPDSDSFTTITADSQLSGVRIIYAHLLAAT